MCQKKKLIFLFFLSGIFITCLKSSPGPGWLSKRESYSTSGQETSWHLWLRSLFFKEVSLFAEDNFLAQMNQLSSHLCSLTDCCFLILPHLGCVWGPLVGDVNIYIYLGPGGGSFSCSPHRWLGS